MGFCAGCVQFGSAQDVLNGLLCRKCAMERGVEGIFRLLPSAPAEGKRRKHELQESDGHPGQEEEAEGEEGESGSPSERLPAGVSPLQASEVLAASALVPAPRRRLLADVPCVPASEVLAVSAPVPVPRRRVPADATLVPASEILAVPAPVPAPRPGLRWELLPSAPDRSSDHPPEELPCLAPDRPSEPQNSAFERQCFLYLCLFLFLWSSWWIMFHVAVLFCVPVLPCPDLLSLVMMGIFVQMDALSPELKWTRKDGMSVRSFEETLTEVELSYDATQAPHVNGRSALFTKQQLWRHVAQSEHLRFICGGRCSRKEAPSKVNDC
ncbi:unnamed protein product [Pleuronectes platessa]|uniref:Uncharacterized protein n=1 Tax=Pleuronectes platessa TaxID=8262 RepID=A0A9N7YTQ1_PLEPL|nr:unnamed protein product [Pleuronectes platessa]